MYFLLMLYCHIFGHLENENSYDDVDHVRCARCDKIICGYN